ncbi:MAG: sel1 repeat family protein [Pseudomonas sp.]|nr:sel1 repeat family protein [Pseudomonas sp.]
MNRSARGLLIGCLLLISPFIALADSNSLIISSSTRCLLNSLPENLPEALAACDEAANSGNSQAQFELGNFYYQGQLVEHDLALALKWFEQASLQGHAEAQHALGMMFFRGEGVPANNVQAYVVLKMAAVNGAEDALDSADLVATQMRGEELQQATQVLGQIFREYLLQLQENNSLFAPQP